MCLAAVEGFGGFAKAARETVVDEGDFEDSCGRMLDFSSFLSDNIETVRAGRTIVAVSVALHLGDLRTFQRIQHAHVPTGASLVSSNFDFIGLGDGGSGLFSVRL